MDYLKESYVFLEGEIRLATMLFSLAHYVPQKCSDRKRKTTTNMAIPFSNGNSTGLLGM